MLVCVCVCVCVCACVCVRVCVCVHVCMTGNSRCWFRPLGVTQLSLLLYIKTPEECHPDTTVCVCVCTCMYDWQQQMLVQTFRSDSALPSTLYKDPRGMPP